MITAQKRRNTAELLIRALRQRLPRFRIRQSERVQCHIAPDFRISLRRSAAQEYEAPRLR